jgi:hypothetical protein
MTVGDHRRQNKHINDNITEQNFVAMRKARDEILAAPKLLHPSLQINIRGGRLPAKKSSYRLLHLPLQYTPSVSTEEW